MVFSSEVLLITSSFATKLYFLLLNVIGLELRR